MVAFFAASLEVVVVICAAFRDWNDMVYCKTIWRYKPATDTAYSFVPDVDIAALTFGKIAPRSFYDDSGRFFLVVLALLPVLIPLHLKQLLQQQKLPAAEAGFG